MKKAFLYLVLLFFSGVSAQELEVDSTAPNDSLPTIKVQKIDSLVLQKMEGDLPTQVVTTQSKDTVLFDLKTTR